MRRLGRKASLLAASLLLSTTTYAGGAWVLWTEMYVVESGRVVAHDWRVVDGYETRAECETTQWLW